MLVQLIVNDSAGPAPAVSVALLSLSLLLLLQNRSKKCCYDSLLQLSNKCRYVGWHWYMYFANDIVAVVLDNKISQSYV